MKLYISDLIKQKQNLCQKGSFISGNIKQMQNSSKCFEQLWISLPKYKLYLNCPLHLTCLPVDLMTIQ